MPLTLGYCFLKENGFGLRLNDTVHWAAYETASRVPIKSIQMIIEASSQIKSSYFLHIYHFKFLTFPGLQFQSWQIWNSGLSLWLEENTTANSSWRTQCLSPGQPILSVVVNSKPISWYFCVYPISILWPGKCQNNFTLFNLHRNPVKYPSTKESYTKLKDWRRVTLTAAFFDHIPPLHNRISWHIWPVWFM